MGTVTALHGDQAAPIPPVRTALDAFAEHLRTARQVSGYYTSAHTIRNYRMTLDKLFIPELPVGELDPDTLAARFRQHWGQASATTWNARRAAARGRCIRPRPRLDRGGSRCRARSPVRTAIGLPRQVSAVFRSTPTRSPG
ncbi:MULTISPECIES: hypothetical protein [unclassified Actinopolyspora]|uniref:hypothetical protein n=1 Tax=unclassified Actinopolyspora TaxID=2639451 RepID=UPI0013F5A5DF|nr:MULTISPECIES: hypothetical protein [unclassified Actinopolyspora]NHD17781.1 hypothetical protein [Actinopolyspora sp. BKK2]NHE76485.1 hypothetical protein [Actinopolyspora sp. BKK1]